MEKIDFGVGMSMPVKPEFRERAELFFGEVINCPQIMKNESYSCYRFINGQVMGITPDENAPTEEEYEKSIWLELVTSDFESTKKRIIDFGVREVKGGMKDAFFFNSPGGVVFRLISEEQAKEMEKLSNES